jgi:hypothetical protein
VAGGPLGALKHRLIAHLHGQAMMQGTLSARQQFFRNFAQLDALLLWKAQLLGPTTMLLRFASLDCAMSGWLHGAMLALYDTATAQFIRVFDDCSEVHFRDVPFLGMFLTVSFFHFFIGCDEDTG